MNMQNPNKKHWLGEYGELQLRWELDPDSLSVEEKARMDELALLGAIEGPEEMLTGALGAMWDCLVPPQEDERTVSSGAVGAAEEAYGPHTYSAAAQSVRSPHQLERLLEAFDREGKTVVRLRDFGPKLADVEHAGKQILKMEGSHVIITVPEGIAFVNRGVENPRRQTRLRRSQLERMEVTFALDENGQVTRIEFFEPQK